MTALQTDPHHHKRADAPLDLKQLEESGVFAGYASVFNIIDSQRDIMQRGAFTKSLQQRQGQIKLLWQHEMSEPIGIIEALREDAQGLYIKGRLLMEIARAREAYALLKRGVVKGLSIGYSPVRYRIDPDSGVRLIYEVDLWEVSLVTFPANEAAQVTVVKSARTTQEAALLHALDRAILTLLSNASS